MPAAAALAASSGSRLRDASAVGDGSEVDAVVNLVEPPFFRGDETCALTSVMPAGLPSNCRVTRSCRSCLQKAGCMIDEFGGCVEQFADRYAAPTNYSMAYATNVVLPNATTTNTQALVSPQLWAFRAFEATYCPASDPICQACIEHRFWSPLANPDSRFCEGHNGCICISDCEDPLYTPNVQCITVTSTETPTTGGEVLYDPVNKNLDSVVKFMILGMCVILLLFAACLFRCIRKDYDHRQRQDRQRRVLHEARAAQRAHQRQQRLEKLGVSALSLSGWQTFRQSQIDKEKQWIDRGDKAGDTTTDPPLSPSATPYVLSIDVVGASNSARPLTHSRVTNTVRPANESSSTGTTSSSASSHVSVQ